MLQSNHQLCTRSLPLSWTAAIFLTLLWLSTISVVAEEIQMDFVMSQSIDKNDITEAQATFRVTVSTDQKDNAWLRQKMRDEVEPILDLMNKQVAKLVEKADSEIKKAGSDDAKKQQIIFDLNSNFDVLVAFTKDAVEYELKQKMLEWEVEKKALKTWKIKTTYEIIRDVAANSFSFGAAVASGGVTEPLTVVDFIKRTVNIANNLRDRLASEHKARAELHQSLLKYIDQNTKIKPSARPTSKQRFANLFSESAEATFEHKLMLYQYKLTELQIAIEKMSMVLDLKLDDKKVTPENLTAYEMACQELISKIGELSKKRLEEGRNMVQVSKQIWENFKAQQSQTQNAINAQRTKDRETVSKVTDAVLTAGALVDPVNAALFVFETACNAVIDKITE